MDVNGDSKIDNDDKMYVGSSLPKVSGGIVNELRWRNFDVNLLLSYQLGRCMVNSTIKKCLSSDLINEALVLDLSKLSFWENPGDKPDFPKYQYDQQAGLFLTVDRDVEKVNYLKIKTLSIGYSIPKEWSKRLRMTDLRIFVSGENLATWTNYSGMDPETVNILNGLDYQKNYPLPRKYTLGLTLKF